MNTKLRISLVMALMLAVLATSAQHIGGSGCSDHINQSETILLNGYDAMFSGGNVRGDHMNQNETKLLSGYDAMFSGGSGRGDHMAQKNGNQWCRNPTEGGTIAAAQTICYGTAPAAFISTALPSGEIGTLEYQWQLAIGTTTSTWVDLDFAGTHTTTYNHVGTLTQTTWFRRLAWVNCMANREGAAATEPVKVTVYPQFNPGTIAATGQTICYNTEASEIVSITAASGGDGSITYSWKSSVDNFTSAIYGATEATYTPGTLTQTTTFSRYAKDGTCITTPEVSVGTWTVTVEPTPVRGTLTKHPDQPSVANGAPVSATLTAGSGGKKDELQYRTHDGHNWSAWEDYAPGENISSADKTQIEIRTRRLGDACSDSEYFTVTWFNADALVFNPNQGTYHNLIQPAIDNAAEGDTIRIKYGTYPENIDTNGKGLTIQPGFSQGIVTVTGTFTLSASDVLEMEFFGDGDYDKFIILDEASITGAWLDINVVGTYKPAAGTRFTIFISPNDPGEFSGSSLIKTNGHHFILSYEENAKNGGYSVVLTAVAPVFKMEIRSVGSDQ